MERAKTINPIILVEQYYEIALCKGYTQDEAELFALQELKNQNEYSSPLTETKGKLA